MADALPEGPDSLDASHIQSSFRQLGSALGIAVLTTVFLSALSSALRDLLSSAGLPAAEADRLAHTVTDSAGAAIGPPAAHPQTASVADAARSAMTDGLALGSCVAAGSVVLGLVATALIPAARVTARADEGGAPDSGPDRDPATETETETEPARP